MAEKQDESPLIVVAAPEYTPSRSPGLVDGDGDNASVTTPVATSAPPAPQ